NAQEDLAAWSTETERLLSRCPDRRCKQPFPIPALDLRQNELLVETRVSHLYPTGLRQGPLRNVASRGSRDVLDGEPLRTLVNPGANPCMRTCAACHTSYNFTDSNSEEHHRMTVLCNPIPGSECPTRTGRRLGILGAMARLKREEDRTEVRSSRS